MKVTSNMHMYLASESRKVNLYRTAFHFDPLVHDSCTSRSLIPWVCGVSSDVVPSWLFVLAVHGLSPLSTHPSKFITRRARLTSRIVDLHHKTFHLDSLVHNSCAYTSLILGHAWFPQTFCHCGYVCALFTVSVKYTSTKCITWKACLTFLGAQLASV